MIVLLYFCCFVLKYQLVKELFRTHVCHVDLYILLPTLNKIYLLTYLLLLVKKKKKVNRNANTNTNTLLAQTHQQ